jgi:hypothetical protein
LAAHAPEQAAEVKLVVLPNRPAGPMRTERISLVGQHSRHTQFVAAVGPVVSLYLVDGWVRPPSKECKRARTFPLETNCKWPHCCQRNRANTGTRTRQRSPVNWQRWQGSLGKGQTRARSCTFRTRTPCRGLAWPHRARCILRHKRDGQNKQQSQQNGEKDRPAKQMQLARAGEEAGLVVCAGHANGANAEPVGQYELERGEDGMDDKTIWVDNRLTRCRKVRQTRTAPSKHNLQRTHISHQLHKPKQFQVMKTCGTWGRRTRAARTVRASGARARR